MEVKHQSKKVSKDLLTYLISVLNIFITWSKKKKNQQLNRIQKLFCD